MKIFYANRKIQFRHFSDLSALNGLISAEDLKLRVPAQENFVIQFIVLPEKEKAIRSVSVNGEMDAVCVNTQGVDKFGKPFSQKICLRKDHIQPVFVIIKADPANEGSTKTAEVVFDTDQGVQKIKLTVDFTGEYVPNGGFNDITRLSRLLWLNSSRFLNNTVVEPFTEPEITGSKIRILGREIYIAESGLVKNAEYYFDEGFLDRLNVLRFEEYTEDWAKFILLNRNNPDDTPAHDYDIVIGPIADDRVGVQLWKYENKAIDLPTLVNNLKYMKGITIQYFFGTERAIQLLKRI